MSNAYTSWPTIRPSAVNARRGAPSGKSVRGEGYTSQSPTFIRASGARLPWDTWAKPPATARRTWARETTPTHARDGRARRRVGVFRRVGAFTGVLRELT